MKTDPLFYELFQAAPQTFFELVQIKPTCSYRFESITVKTSKFKTWNYKELSRMLRLTPLRETTSGQELLKEDRIEILLNQIEVKFEISAEVAERLEADLTQLDINTLKVLLRQLLRLDTFEQLQLWITDHLAERVV